VDTSGSEGMFYITILQMSFCAKRQHCP